jgi:hypothetical protein
MTVFFINYNVGYRQGLIPVTVTACILLGISLVMKISSGYHVLLLVQWETLGVLIVCVGNYS